MAWIALAPRRPPPKPRPRLWLVKADLNPYKGLTEDQFWNVHSGLQQAILSPLTQGSIPKYQEELKLLEQQMVAQGLLQAPVHAGTGQPLGAGPSPLDNVASWEKLVGLAEAAAPQMEQALIDSFSWPKLPASVQGPLAQGQIATALGNLVDFGVQQMEQHYIPAFTDLAEGLFTDVAAAQWPALKAVLQQSDIDFELPSKLPDDLFVQRALRYVREEGLKRAADLWASTVAEGQTIIRTGLAEGQTTPKIAQNLFHILGLTGPQIRQLQNYQYGLAEAGTPKDKADKLADKMHDTLLRRRARVIARTETIAALNVAADTFFEAAQHEAQLPATALRRFWLNTFDSRTCSVCQAIPGANEQGKAFNEPFLTGSGPLLRPPAHPQCRCVVIVRPTVLAAPGLAVPPLAPTPTVLPAPMPFPPPAPPPKAKKPKAPPKPKKPKAPVLSPATTSGDVWAAMSHTDLQGAKAGMEAALKAPNLDPGVQAILQQDLHLINQHLAATPPPTTVAPPPAPPPPPMVSASWSATSPAPAWATDPPPAFWAKTPDVDVGPTPKMPAGKVSTGVVMLEDGKIWVYEPKNHYGGYHTAFPKGQVEPNLSGQQNALKEVYEEAGLHAKITGFLGDFPATTGTTRLYFGTKIGGNPTKFGDETWSVKLLTPADLEAALKDQKQSYPLAALHALKSKGLIPGTPTPSQPIATPQVSNVPTAAPVVAPATPVVPPSTAPKKPPPAPKAKPLKATDQVDLEAAKGEFVATLGGSTGAERWKGTDGVERAVKGPAPQQAFQEFVANKLYRELGIDAPDQKLVMSQGKIAGVASTWEPGTQTLERAGVTKERAQGVLKGFVADVWLGNRDALGLTMDNILVQGNRLIRIDNGGALMYRAQGSLKPKEWTEQIGEWQGLQDPKLNKHYAGLFQTSGYGTAQGIPDLLEQVKAIQQLRDRTNGFHDLVPSAPGITPTERKAVVTLLQKRARLLEEQVGLAAPVEVIDHAAREAALRKYLGSSYDRYARIVAGKGPSTVQEYEKVAIYAYTGIHYDAMNQPFWTSRDPAVRAQEMQERAPLIEAAISGLPQFQPGTVGETYYRGVRSLPPDYIARVSKAGNEIELEGFASTTIDKKVAVDNFHGDKNLFVIVSAGGNFDVRTVSQFGRREGEFLYPPSARFRVTHTATRDAYSNGRVFYLEEIPAVSKRGRVGKADAGAQDDEAYPRGEMIPEGFNTWTQEQVDAWGISLLREIDAHVYTPEERAAAEHFALKQESAHLAPETPTS